MNKSLIGWDIGGAHLKAAHIDQSGVILNVVQLPCPLWQGIDKLSVAVETVISIFESPSSTHVVTMTGELVDLFANRFEGVKQIIQLIQSRLNNNPVYIFAGDDRFLRAHEVTSDRYDDVASMNWLASARWVAAKVDSALFLDIGSTTTDVFCINKHKLLNEGVNDFDRLCSGEMVYTGVVRTPVMAIVGTVDFERKKVGLMAEYFATMADIYRITGELDETSDQYPAADHGDKTIEGSARRLARMIGRDYESAEPNDWLALANQLRALQICKVSNAIEGQLKRTGCLPPKILIGAGVGRFLARELAAQWQLYYQDFSDLLVQQNPCGINLINDCAPAVALASLALNQLLDDS